MPRVHNHYDNLKVARDASPEAIRSAYRALTRRHHPDRNPDNADAVRIMTIVNVAYSVLSDAGKRSEHDEWIAQNEGTPIEPLGVLAAGRPVIRRTTSHVPVRRPDAEASSAGGSRRARRKLRRAPARLVQRVAIGATIGAALLWLALEGVDRLQQGGVRAVAIAMTMPGQDDHSLSTAMPPVLPVPGWVRTPLAPNGRPWPAGSGYVDAYPQLNGTGLSQVTADNRQNAHEMFVKLVSLDGPTPLAVRTFKVAAGTRFTLVGVTGGTYDLRYRDLSTGLVVRTPAFILEEVSTPQGLQPSAPSITLDPTGNGNLRNFALNENEF